MFKRCLALMLCVLMLPVAALADAAPGLRFRLSFEMNSAVYPDGVQDVIPGLADLLNVTTVEGLLTGQDGSFDLKADLLLGGHERTRTDIRLFGTEETWCLRSSLLGDETLTFAMSTLLEFALKGYAHTGVPFQRAAILFTPYVHKAPFAGCLRIAEPVLFAKEGSRTISRGDLTKMAQRIAEEADASNSFHNWTMAMASESGYDEYLMDLLRRAPEWIASFVPKAGVTVKVDDASETWTAGKLTLLRRETDLSGAQIVTLTLPPMADGSVISADAALQPDGDLTHFSVNLLIEGRTGETLLDLHADGSLPTSLPVMRSFSLTWDAEGLMVGGEGVHLRFVGEPTAQGVAIRQLTPDLSTVMLTVNAELETDQVDFTPASIKGGTYVFSIDSDTMNDLVSRVMSPMLRGLLPLIAQAPTSSCQTLMNLLEDSGVFSLLTDGFSSGEESWEESEDWEDWDSWDE